MATPCEADAATQALIAQMMAEDLGESFEHHLRPIGSHAADYEDPLTSYQRQCLENPDMEDGEGGWNPPTPRIEPVEAPLLPEGATWDSSINDDPRIESTPAITYPPVSGSEDDDSEGGVELEYSPLEAQKGVDLQPVFEEPLHYIQDTVDYHADTHTQSLARRASLPVQELVSPTSDGRRVISDPSRLETPTDAKQGDPPSPTSLAPQLQSQEPNPLSPHPLAPKAPDWTNPLPIHSAFAGSIATNERLLNLTNDISDLKLGKTATSGIYSELENSFSTIDTSFAKNKGKAPATGADTDRVRILEDRMRDLRAKCRRAYSPHRNDETNVLSAKKKGKAREGSENSDLSDDDLDGDELIDKQSGLLLLRVPWPQSGRREREFQEAMDAQVDEICVGEHETLDSILKDIAERKEISERPWGSWGFDADDGGTKGKGKGRAVECH